MTRSIPGRAGRRPSATSLLNVAVFLTGLFVFSAQVLVYAYITRVYPPAIAPMIMSGSVPAITASGSGMSGGS